MSVVHSLPFKPYVFISTSTHLSNMVLSRPVIQSITKLNNEINYYPRPKKQIISCQSIPQSIQPSIHPFRAIPSRF